MLRDGRSIHAQDFGKQWAFHWDKLDPLVNGFEHLRRDCPSYYTLACSSIAGGVGAGIGALAKKEGGAVFGAIIGGMLGALFGLATAEWEESG